MRGVFLVASCLLALVAQGCSSLPTTARSSSPNRLEGSTKRASTYPIQHIVIIIQENRSFDNIFAGFPGADAPTFGYMHNGKMVTLKKVGFDGIDLDHGYTAALVDFDNGKMDGFNLTSPNQRYPYSYVNRTDVRPYWDMAQQYVLADRMFPSELGGSFAAHLNLIAGTDKLSPTLAEADNPSNTPWGCDAPAGTTTSTVDSNRNYRIGGPFPCFTQFQTMADIMDPAGVSWKYYAPQTLDCPKTCNGGGLIWSVFDSISNVRNGPDWTNDIINPETQILNDAANGTLPSIAWVVPEWKNSDHPNTNSDTGPSWVAAVVNAIGNGPDWKSTAIVVLWDDWGGWYDDAPPPQLDWEGLAIRVPAIIISPYARKSVVTHTQYESGSILKFMEEVNGLPSLGGTDQRANALDDSFDFSQKPRRFRTIPAKYPPPLFLKEHPSGVVPDAE